MTDLDVLFQKTRDENLSRQIRGRSEAGVRAALSSGANAHAWDGYCLTLAMMYTDDSCNSLKLVADAMFGSSAYAAIISMDAIGYSPAQITEMMCKTYQAIPASDVVLSDVNLDNVDL